MATAVFFFSPGYCPQDSSHFWTGLYLGLEQDYPPDHLRNNAANGWYSHFSNRALPLGTAGTPFTGYHPGQTPDLARIAVAARNRAAPTTTTVPAGSSG
jgi:hypothetical protein